MNRLRKIFDFLTEANIYLLIVSFPLSRVWFNNFWDALILIWLVGKVVSKDQGKSRIPPTPPSGGMLTVFVIGMFVSSLVSVDHTASVSGTKHLLKGILLCVMSYDFFSADAKRIGRSVSLLIGSAVLVSLDALVQLTMSRDLFGNPLIASRATAFFPHPFYLALWSGIALYLCVVRLINSRSKKAFATYLLCVLSLGAAFLLSKTRAAWVAMGLTFVGFSLFLPNKKRVLGVFLLLAAVSSLLFVFDDSMRMRALSIIKADDPRLLIWKQSLAAVQAHFTSLNWLFGRGPGTFSLEYPSYDPTREGSIFPHLIGLELFYAFGLIGLILFAVWISSLIYAVIVMRMKSPSLSSGWPLGLLPVVVLLLCLINESFFSRYFSFLFWFFTGITFSLLHHAKTHIPASDADRELG